MVTSTSLHPAPEHSATSEDVSSTCSTMTSTPSAHPTSSSSESHTCPYKDCRKSFSKKYNLKAHLRLHTGEQPFQCERPDCRKKFKWRSSLSSHTVWHTRKDNATANSSDTATATATETTKKDPRATKPEASAVKVSKPSPLKAKQKDSTSPTKASRKPVPWSSQTTASDKPPSSATSSPPNKKKRPRAELSRQRSCKTTATTPSATGEQDWSSTASGSAPCATPGGIGGSGDEGVTATAEMDDRDVKRRRVDESKREKPSDSVTDVEGLSRGDAAAEDMMSPGSPVTSDGGCTEPTLDLDIFSCGVLPPLLDGGEDGLGFGGEDVVAVLGSSNEVDMFGLASPPCGALNMLDTRFGPFDLDNLQTFCLNKAEGM